MPHLQCIRDIFHSPCTLSECKLSELHSHHIVYNVVCQPTFFMPLQLGGREGGFLMSVSGLGLTTSAGIFVALIVRIRELIWTAIGLLFIKISKTKKKNKTKQIVI